MLNPHSNPDGRGRKKAPIYTMGAFFLELITRFELVTSSLPRTRSTD